MTDAQSPTRKIFFAAFLHYLAYVFMQTLCLIAETKRGPSLSDRLHELIPANRNLEVFNSTIWLPGVIGFILLLGFRRPASCVNYLRIGAMVSILRGIFVYATTLGPPAAIVLNPHAGMQALTMSQITPALLIRQWLPFDVLYGGSGLSAAYLTQDLFFSGHTATTVLFLIVLSPRDRWFWPAFLFHVITVGLLLVTHEHYTIDILGAYFIVYAVHAFFERRCWLLLVPI